MECGEAQIAAANVYTLMLFQAIKKSDNQRGINILQAKAGRRFMQLFLCELQKLTEGISVGTNRVRARLSLLHQTVCEEAF
jgi:hypothetical protein